MKKAARGSFAAFGFGSDIGRSISAAANQSLASEIAYAHEFLRGVGKNPHPHLKSRACGKTPAA
jgi:hypothetical protein